MDKRIEEDTRITTVIVTEDVPNAGTETTAEAVRKAEFKKVKEKIMADHDELFRMLA